MFVCVREKRGVPPVSALWGTQDLDNNHRHTHTNTLAVTLFEKEYSDS